MVTLSPSQNDATKTEGILKSQDKDYRHNNIIKS